MSDGGSGNPRASSIVKILGREYRLSGDEDPAHLEEVASYLDRMLRDIQRTLPDTQDAAMLAALNLASELMSLRSSLLDRRRVQSLIDLVDSV
jgi:cell division protein ZapA